MNRFGPAFIISVLLHVGLIALAFISWKTAPRPDVVISVPVEIVSNIPSREMAEAPVDELAVKTPAPEPAPEEPVKVEPKPEPAPKLPVPVPQKAVAPAPKPDKKPEPPKPVAKTPPAKDGLKKPEPPKTAKAAPKDDFLSRLAATPSKASTRQPAKANTKATNGASNAGSGPADAGEKVAMDALGQRLQRQWILNCDVPGSRQVNPHITLMLSSNGRVLMAEWDNKRNDPVWVAGANLALAAVNKGQPYTGLPDGLYNKKLGFTFSAQEACNGQ